MMTKTKLKAWVGPLAGAILFSAAIWILHLELSVHHLKDILQHIHSLPAERIAAALLLTAAGYGVMATYDLLARRYQKQTLAYGKVPTRWIAKTIHTVLRPMGRLRKRRSTFPLRTTWRQLHDEQRISSGFISTVKTTLP